MRHIEKFHLWTLITPSYDTPLCISLAMLSHPLLHACIVLPSFIVPQKHEPKHCILYIVVHHIHPNRIIHPIYCHIPDSEWTEEGRLWGPRMGRCPSFLIMHFVSASFSRLAVNILSFCTLARCALSTRYRDPQWYVLFCCHTKFPFGAYCVLRKLRARNNEIGKQKQAWADPSIRIPFPKFHRVVRLTSYYTCSEYNDYLTWNDFYSDVASLQSVLAYVAGLRWLSCTVPSAFKSDKSYGLLLLHTRSWAVGRFPVVRWDLVTWWHSLWE